MFIFYKIQRRKPTVLTVGGCQEEGRSMFNFKKIVVILASCTLLSTVSYPLNTYASEIVSETSSSSKQGSFILDVDMSTDVDDLLAVRAAEKLDKNGTSKLLAVMMSVSDGEDALAGLLTYDGYGNIPVGICSSDVYENSPYWAYLEGIEETNEKIDAVTLYRKILAESSNKVSILTTGYLGNISKLLQSEPDEYSELSGRELVAQKCKAIHIMGGSYPEGFDNNLAATSEALEASTYVFNKWPGESPLIIYTNDLGNWITTGSDLADTDPLKACFALAGKPDGGASWDVDLVWIYGTIENKISDDYDIKLKRTDVHMIADSKDVALHDTQSGNEWRIITNENMNNIYENEVQNCYQ